MSGDMDRIVWNVQHTFKTHPEPFEEMWHGRKKADLRDLSDRQLHQMIQVGDAIVFREYDNVAGTYPGRSFRARVTHIQTGYCLPDGCVMISYRISKRYSQ